MPAIGTLVLGQSRTLGATQHGSRIGITDYSIKTADEFGNFLIVERSFSKNAEFTVFVDNEEVDALQVIMEDFRATPVLWIGSNLFASTIVIGFYKDFVSEFTYMETSVCTLQLEGLT